MKRIGSNTSTCLIMLDSSKINSPHNKGILSRCTTVESNLTSVTCLCLHDRVTLVSDILLILCHFEYCHTWVPCHLREGSGAGFRLCIDWLSFCVLLVSKLKLNCCQCSDRINRQCTFPPIASHIDHALTLNRTAPSYHNQVQVQGMYIVQYSW